MPIAPLRVAGLDLRDLRASGLSDETISLNNIYTERDVAKLARLLNRVPERPSKDFKEFMQSGGMVFPYRDLNGVVNCFARVRPHDPRYQQGKPVKYESPVGSHVRAYFPRDALKGLREGDRLVYITEGEKKALALAQLGLVAIGLGGIWCGCKKTDSGSHQLIDDLREIVWCRRLVYVVFDYDTSIKTRHHSAAAARRLATVLRLAGADEVYWVELPPGPGGSKQGVDDFLVARGPEAFTELSKRAEPVPVLATLRNYRTDRYKDADGVYKDSDVGLTVKEIHEQLTELIGPWPRRVDKLLFAAPYEDEPICFLEKAKDTFAWIGSQVDEPVNWVSGRDKVSQSVFDAYLRQSVKEYESVECYPHWPLYPRHYYHHPALQGGDGKALNAFLDFFCPETPHDRSLIMAAVLTVFWGGLPGDRPAFVIEPPEEEEEPTPAATEEDNSGRGIGKTTMVKVISWLVDGHIDILPTDDFNKVKTRLLTPAALTKRVVLIDNLKAGRFSSAEFEQLVTTDTISGHRMYTGDARRPNTLTWFLTMNSGSLSKDAAQRSVTIRLRRPAYSATWESELRTFIDENRWAIIGDIIAQLKDDKPKLSRHTRWGPWEQQVLACVTDPQTCQELIAQRRAAIDGDQEESDCIRDAFRRLLKERGHDPDKDAVFIASSIAAEIVNDETGQDLAPQRVTLYLQDLTIPELKKTYRGDMGRGWTWRKRGSTMKLVRLNPPRSWPSLRK
jgi:hypothetical protein